MSVRRIVYHVLLLGLAIGLVLAINYLLEAMLAFFVPGATLTPEGTDLFSLLVWGLFLIIDILTIIAVFKWLRK